MLVSSERETSIVVAPTHADAVQRSIERNQRYEDQTEFARRNRGAVDRFRDAESAAYDRRLLAEFSERHRPFGSDAGCVHGLTASPRRPDDRVDVDLIVECEVDPDTARPREVPRADHSSRYFAGCCVPIVVVEGTPTAEIQPAQFPVGAGGHRQNWSGAASGRKRRLPLVPLRPVALEPEQQVGPAVMATGLPTNRPCSNASDSTRPRDGYLGSKGIQDRIEHRRRRLKNSIVSEVELLCIAEHGFYAIGDALEANAYIVVEFPVLRAGPE